MVGIYCEKCLNIVCVCVCVMGGGLNAGFLNIYMATTTNTLFSRDKNWWWCYWFTIRNVPR